MDEDQGPAAEGESPPVETPEEQPPVSGPSDAPSAAPTAQADDTEDQPPAEDPDTKPRTEDSTEETADPATPQDGENVADATTAEPSQGSATTGGGDVPEVDKQQDQEPEEPEGDKNADEVATEPVHDSEAPASNGDVQEVVKEAQDQEEPEGDENTNEVATEPTQDSETPASGNDVHEAAKEAQDQEEQEGDATADEIIAEPVGDSVITGSNGDVNEEAKEKALDQEEPKDKDPSTQLAESGGSVAEDKSVTAEVILAVIEASGTAEDGHITLSEREEDGKTGEAVAMEVPAGSDATSGVLMMTEGNPDVTVPDKQVLNMAKFIAEEVIAVGQAEVQQGMYPKPGTEEVAVSVPVPGEAPAAAATRSASAGFRPYSETPQLSDGAPPATPEPPPTADRPCRGDWHNKTVDDLIKMGVPDLRLARCLDWGRCEIRGWLTGLGLPQYADALLNNGICGRTLCLVTASNLPRMGITDWEHIKTIAGSARQLLSVDDYILYEQQWEKPPPGNMTRALYLQRAWPNGQPPPSSQRYLQFLEEFGFLDVLAEITNRPIVEIPQEQVNPLYKEITVASIISVASKQSKK